MAQERIEKTLSHLQFNPLNILTAAQQLQYDQDGYIIIRKLVPPADLEVYRQRFVDISCNTVEREATMIVMRDVKVVHLKENNEAAITKLQDYQDDPVLFSYCQHPAILPYVQSFVGPNVKSVHTMLINKPPDPGSKSSRHPLHQDLYYFPFRPAERIVCSWTAMQRVTRENGCLVLFPKSHKLPLLEHGYPDWAGGVNKMYHGIVSVPENQFEKVYAEMEAGDTVFFHPLLIHGSGANRTQGFRKAISCHYASADCHYIDVKGTVQAPIADEVEGISKRKAGMEVDFCDVWRFKSRLVAGQEGTLD